MEDNDEVWEPPVTVVAGYSPVLRTLSGLVIFGEFKEHLWGVNLQETSLFKEKIFCLEIHRIRAVSIIFFHNSAAKKDKSGSRPVTAKSFHLQSVHH